jgi:hypothetical protein
MSVSLFLSSSYAGGAMHIAYTALQPTRSIKSNNNTTNNNKVITIPTTIAQYCTSHT